MHSTSFEDTTLFHNGDFSGDVKISQGDEEMEVPFEALEKLVAKKYRMKKIQEIEDAKLEEILS